MITRYWVVRTNDKEYRYSVTDDESSREVMLRARHQYSKMIEQGIEARLGYYCTNTI
jgi:hypothetical protein